MKPIFTAFALAIVASGAWSQAAPAPAAVPQASTDASSFQDASAGIARQLEEAINELNALRESVTAEKLPLNRRLTELEGVLAQKRSEYQQATRKAETSSLALANLTRDIQKLQDQERYLSGLLGDYVRKFDSSLHIAEIKRFEGALSEAQLAPENQNLSSLQVFQAQIGLVSTSMGRIEDAMGGNRFEGTAVDALGVVRQGAFVQFGPAVLFRSADGQAVGVVEERLGSQEPTIFPFADPTDIADADALCAGQAGRLTLDPTMGNALKMAQIEETLWEHILKGGPVMWPILGVAAAALLMSLYKWIYLLTQRVPSQAKLDAVLAAIAERNHDALRSRVAELRGPVRRVLEIGVEHIREPRELIEEAMFEAVLTTKTKLQSLLPFVAISASSAPLLGLLGTVTGIISTFDRITVFGSGDVKSLSGGISEALITTEWGLYVAIPSLLAHAFLTRKAKAIAGQMESASVAFVTELSRSQLPAAAPAPAAPHERRASPVKV
jgi:biopolymer transport protein ExbB